jgi:hypothetical protein
MCEHVRVIMPLTLLLSALMLPEHAEPAPLAGSYMLVGVREAAGGLELKADGRFRYAFTYGALDEQAEGRWRLDGNRVLLTTDPTPKPPEWSLVVAEPGDPKVFALILEGPNGEAIPNIEVKVGMADGSVETGQTIREWLEADLDGVRKPVSVSFRVPVFEITSPSFPVDVARNRRYRFRLDPRDLGVRDFLDWPLEIRGDMLAPPDAPQGEGFRRMEVRD